MKNLKDFINAHERRKSLELELKVDLSSVADFSFTEDQVKNKNIENLIGATQIPLGIAGPLKIAGKFAQGSYYLPLATTEGALVASVSRGCKAVSLGKNFTVGVEDSGMTRGAVFKVDGLRSAQEFISWLKANFTFLKKIAEQTSRHLVLQKIETENLGKSVFVRFVFQTADAMGMNMVTKAVSEIAKTIYQKKKINCLSLAGNFDIDKKPAWLNFIKGRGKKVRAEVTLSSQIVNEVLKTTPSHIQEVSYHKLFLGSALSGSLGFNAHYANIIAAIFCATGQDLAHTTEGSLGITTTEITGQDLYISIYLPNLVIGTVGGGTNLPAQKDALKILGIPDSKLVEGEQVLKFAEIIAGAVLAGELSLLAALAANDLASAHEELGRGRR